MRITSPGYLIGISWHNHPTMTTSTLKRTILLRMEGCPYCRNAEEALDKANIKYEKLEVPRNDRSIVEQLSGQSTVPILVEVIGSTNQDDDIIEYVKQK